MITGCASGLGLSLARRVLLAGDQVVLTARNAHASNSLAELHRKYPTQSIIVDVDVTKCDMVQSSVQACLERFGCIDVLVNNAGRGLVGALEEYSEQQIRECFEVNFFGAVNTIKAVLPLMREQKSGRIINISAIAGIANEVGFSIYGAAKFALEGMTEALHFDLRHLGIKVLLIEPGPFRTEFIEKSMERSETTIDDYKQSCGKFASFLTKLSGTQSGDPQKAADVIFQAAGAERPPLRVVLGPFAHKKVREKMRRLQEELDVWESIAGATDFEVASV
jgi:NAD(P)-dependent dehydrogenase (short-subunit alcohol dehydrogenase family)